MRWMWAGVISVGIAGAAQADVPRVAVDIAPVHSIVARVMGSLGTPDLVVPPGASPHDHAMRPSEARALDSAGMIVWVGPNLTPWLEGAVATLGEGAVSMPLMDVPGTFQLEIRKGANFAAHDHAHGHGHSDDNGGEHADEHADGHGHEHEQGDSGEHAHDHKGGRDHADDHADAHGHIHKDDQAHDHSDEHIGPADGVDAHAWLDPQNAAVWAGAIASALSAQDPENAAVYASNAQTFQEQMTALETEINATLAGVRGRPFVVFHDAYHYFEHRFEIEAVGSITDTDASAPSAGRVSDLQASIADMGAVCALTEPQFNPGLLAALGPVKLGEIDPVGAKLEPGPDLYPAMLRAMADALVSCLE